MIGKTETKNGVTYKINEDCSITVNGTPTDYIPFNLLNMSLKAGTYKFADGLNSDNVFLQSLGDFSDTSQNHTFSLAEDGKATVYLVIMTGAPTLNNVTLYPMIYEGTEDKPYEQYGASPSPDYPSEIETVNGSVEIKVDNGLETTDTNYQSYTKTLPIQQEMLEGDYIEDVEHHGWGKYEITGNEDWKKSGNPNNISYYLIINSILVNIDGNTFSPSSSESETKVAIVLSNHFKAISPNQLFEGSENGICLNWVGEEKQMRLGLGLDSDINTVDNFKAWLKSLYDAGTPVIVYYKLATPKSLELTSEQKAIRDTKLYTYKNVTNIDVSNELASIDVTYKKDLETMFNNIIKQIPSSTSDTAET